MTDNTTPVKEIKIPVADPNDPYAIPAAMPSSVDHAVRSFNAGDYPEPSRKQDERVLHRVQAFRRNADRSLHD